MVTPATAQDQPITPSIATTRPRHAPILSLDDSCTPLRDLLTNLPSSLDVDSPLYASQNQVRVSPLRHRTCPSRAVAFGPSAQANRPPAIPTGFTPRVFSRWS